MRCLNFLDGLLTQECWYVPPPCRDGLGGYKYDSPLLMHCRIEKSNSIYEKGPLDAGNHDSVGYFKEKLLTDGFIYDRIHSYDEVVERPDLEGRMRIMKVLGISDLMNKEIKLYEVKLR